MIASDRLFEPFNDGQTVFGHGYTFGGHPVSAAVALANLDIFEREGINAHVKESAPAFRATLEKLYDLPIVGDVRGEGFFYGIELVKDKATKETFNDEESERLLRGFLTPRAVGGRPVLPRRRPRRPSGAARAAADQRPEGVRRDLRHPAQRAERSQRRHVAGALTSAACRRNREAADRSRPLDGRRPSTRSPTYPADRITIVPVPRRRSRGHRRGRRRSALDRSGRRSHRADLADGGEHIGGRRHRLGDRSGMHVARDGRVLICD